MHTFAAGDLPGGLLRLLLLLLASSLAASPAAAAAAQAEADARAAAGGRPAPEWRGRVLYQVITDRFSSSLCEVGEQDVKGHYQWKVSKGSIKAKQSSAQGGGQPPAAAPAKSVSVGDNIKGEYIYIIKHQREVSEVSIQGKHQRAQRRNEATSLRRQRSHPLAAARRMPQQTLPS